MKLGLLGIDDQMAQVVAAARRRGDALVIACDVAAGSRHEPLLAGVPRDASWEAIIDPRTCDAVLVAHEGWSERREEGVRKLVQAGRSLLVSQPLVLSMLWAYEIDMIRKDSGATVIPFLPDRLHPFVGRLRSEIEAALAGAGPLGRIETLSMDRGMRDRSRDAVLAQLARDADLVRVCGGDPARLSTLGSGDQDTAWSTLAVGFTGPAHLPVRWQVTRDHPTGGLRLVLTGTDGTCAVERPDDPARPWRMAVASETGTAEIPPPSFDAGEAMLDVLRAACEAEQAETPAQAVASTRAASWADAARAIELAESVPRSLAKGRSIDLHKEEFSEIGTFKGTMASLGCAIVLAGLFLLLLATLLGGIAREAGWPLVEQVAGAWPTAVLAVLGVFLALQLLPLLIGAGPADGPPAPDDRPPPPHGHRE